MTVWMKPTTTMGSSGRVCGKCGSLNLYADDTTYCIANNKREDNNRKIIETLEEIKYFLAENDLHLNVGKTTLFECMIPQKRGKTPGEPPQLIVEEEPGKLKTITDKGMCRVLGVNLQGNMTWMIHLESGEKALLPHVRKLLGALVHQGKKIPRNCRKTLATGLIVSQLQYTISIWGATMETRCREPS